MANTIPEIPTSDPGPGSSVREGVSNTSVSNTSVRTQAAQVADASKQQVAGVADDALAETRRLVSRSREELRQQADEQAKRLGAALTDVSRQLSAMANGDGAEGVLRDVTNELSALASRGGTRLRDSGLQDTVDEVKQFARRRPGMFLLASLGAGMVIGRLGRSVDLHAVAQTAQSRGAGESPQVPPPSEW
jgi:hypothetical protein